MSDNTSKNRHYWFTLYFNRLCGYRKTVDKWKMCRILASNRFYLPYLNICLVRQNYGKMPFKQTPSSTPNERQLNVWNWMKKVLWDCACKSLLFENIRWIILRVALWMWHRNVQRSARELSSLLMSRKRSSMPKVPFKIVCNLNVR